MSDPLLAIQKKITKLEKQVETLQENNLKWRQKYYRAQAKLDKLENPENTINPKELEHLRVENGKLRTQLNNVKRDIRADAKLKKIEAIIKGG